MRRITAFCAVLLAAFVLAGCSTMKKSMQPAVADSGAQLVKRLSGEPPVSELTASVRYELSGHSLSGQLRMRRGRCIQLSAGLLGIEAFRVELFPDHVMIMDRTGSRYVECHYADLPLRNSIGFDYNMLEAVFWNRLFSPECQTEDDILSAMKVGKRMADGSLEIRDAECDNVFRTDAGGHLVEFRKSGPGWNFSVDYSGFSEVDGGYEFPAMIGISLSMPGMSELTAGMKLSGLSVQPGTWKDETRPTRRMKPVSMDDILELLELIGL
ncbi:MAG: DUF4292 domain-containing protein [Bacteroidaceae bacterium]|nr:DUF4292 domain-containing protein [Bacteroidaceae bacterium]